jgi:putative ABC transport system permease protein
MTLRNLLWFYRRRLGMRARQTQELFAVLGIAVGVALLFAVQVSSTSVNASVAQVTEQIVGDAQLQLRARGPEGFSDEVIDRVRDIDGVVAAAPLLDAQANVVGPRGAKAVTLIAGTPALARLRGHLLTGLTAGRLVDFRAIALPVPVADAIGVGLGSNVRLEVNGRTVRASLGAIVGKREVGALADAPLVVAPLKYGQALANLPGLITRIYVLAKAGQTDAVRAALRRVAGDEIDVKRADSDGRVFKQAAVPNDQSAALFAGISAFVGFLFAFNAVLLMSRERRGLIADLRLSGYPLRAVTQVLLFDALVVGVVASALGLLLGDQLSRHVFQPSPGYLSIAFPVGTARTIQWQTVGLALAGGTLAAVAAMVPPLIAAARSPALGDELGRDALDHENAGKSGNARWRVAVSIGCLAITTVILVAAPRAALVGVFTLVLSMLLALPTILSRTLVGLDRLRRRPQAKGIIVPIAIGELMSAGSRSVAIAAVAALAVFSNTAIEGARLDLQRGLDPISHELNAVTDLWVSPAGDSNTLATTPFRAEKAIARLARSPHIRSIRVYRGSFLDLGDRRVWVIAPERQSREPFPSSQLVEGGLSSARKRLRAGGWAVLSQAMASRQSLRVGDRFTLYSPRPMSFRLAGISTNFGWSPGTIVLNSDDYRRAWGTADASALHIELRGGVSTQQGRRLVLDALGPSFGLAVETPRQREDRHRAVTRQGLERLRQIAALVLIAAALAMAAATGGMIWQRRRMLADLKLAGIANHRELWGAVLLESALLLAIGCFVGALYGLYAQRLLDRALNAVTGFPVADSVGVIGALTSFAIVTSVASIIAMVPGWLAARVPADVALRD